MSSRLRPALRRRPARRLAALAAMAALAGACQALAPSASPGAPLVLGLDWGRAPGVEGPPNFRETLPPSFHQDHPILRFPGQAIFTDATNGQGTLVAVGYVPPDFTPAAWTSSNGLTWAYHAIDSTAFTFPVAVASGAEGGFVAVGRRVKDAVAWTSSHGARWEIHEVPTLGGADAERMNAVVATSVGFVAGGSAGPEGFERHARFWTSPDGVRWDPVADQLEAFADAEVTGLTQFRNGLVAVGVLGSAQHHTGSVAWTSPDGRTWTRVEDPAFAGGVAASVIAAPFGGLLAVGTDLDRKAALVWLSPDGRRWTKVTAGDYGDKRNLWMTDVVAVGDRVIAVGTSQASQRPSATSWVSVEGTHWDQAEALPVLGQVEFLAVAADGPRAIALGRFGGPDSAVPTIMVTPGSGDLAAP